MKEIKQLFQSTLWALVFSCIIISPCQGETKRLFRIGTGGKTGVYYPIGKQIAQGITEISETEEIDPTGEKISNLIGVAQNSAGSVENIQNVASGAIEAGLAQADIAAWAFEGAHVFEGNKQLNNIRAIASLYPEKFQIVVRKDAKITSISDIRGKRFSIDEIGSGTLVAMRIILEAHGLSEKDFFPVYLKPIFTQDKIISGELQGFAMMAGTPMEAVTRLVHIGITLVPILPEVASLIHNRYPYLVPGIIPANTYPDIPETSTLMVHALLIVNSKLDETLAYYITKCLWNQRTLALLKEGHPQGNFITPETALIGLSIPLHPGAKRYYLEHGLLQKESLKP